MDRNKHPHRPIASFSAQTKSTRSQKTSPRCCSWTPPRSCEAVCCCVSQHQGENDVLIHCVLSSSRERLCAVCQKEPQGRRCIDAAAAVAVDLLLLFMLLLSCMPAIPHHLQHPTTGSSMGSSAVNEWTRCVEVVEQLSAHRHDSDELPTSHSAGYAFVMTFTAKDTPLPSRSDWSKLMELEVGGWWKRERGAIEAACWRLVGRGRWHSHVGTVCGWEEQQTMQAPAKFHLFSICPCCTLYRCLASSASHL